MEYAHDFDASWGRHIEDQVILEACDRPESELLEAGIESLHVCPGLRMFRDVCVRILDGCQETERNVEVGLARVVVRGQVDVAFSRRTNPKGRHGFLRE